MRRAAFRTGTQAEDRAEGIAGRTLRALRRMRLRRFALETLEDRTLLATLPGTSAIQWQNLNTLIGESQFLRSNSSTPVVVADPNNPNDLAAVWVRTADNLPIYEQPGSLIMFSIVEGAYSLNGGTTWQPMNAITQTQFEQTDVSVVPPNPGFINYSEVTDPSLAFDGSHNLYFTWSMHSQTYLGGAIEIEKFNFNGAAPTVESMGGGGATYKKLYEWNGTSGSGAAFTPTLAVDSTPPPFPAPLGVNVGPAGNVFVSTPTGNRVIQFDSTTGALLNVYATAGQNNPQYQAFDPANSELYVPNLNNQSVTAYTNINSTPPTSNPAFTIQGESLNVPHSAVYGPDGNLYVANFANSDVLEFDGYSGAFIKTFVKPASGGLNSPDGLAFDPSGNLYVSSSANSEVLEYSSTGSFIGPAIGPVQPAQGNNPAVNLSTTGALVYDNTRFTGGFGNLFIANPGTYPSPATLPLNPNPAPGSDSLVAYNPSAVAGTQLTDVFQGLRLNAPAGTTEAVLPIGRNGANLNVLLVASKFGNAVLEYDAVSGAYIGPFATGIAQPDSVVQDSAGNVYISSSASNTIYRYTAAGVPNPGLGQQAGSNIFVTGGALSAPQGMAFDPISGKLFVVSSGNSSVVAYPLAGGGGQVFVNQSLKLLQPDGIAFDASGTLYVASSGTNAVATFFGTAAPLALQGTFIANFVSPGSAGLRSPRGVAFDPNTGNLFVSGATGVYEYQGPNGASPGAPVGSGLYNGTNINGGNGITFENNAPAGATEAVLPLGPGGSNLKVLLVADKSSNAVLEYNAASGAYLGTFVTGINQPDSVVQDAAGNVYISSFTDNAIYRYDKTGKPVPGAGQPVGSNVFSNAGMSGPEGMAFDPLSGDLFVVSSASNSVERIPAAGGAAAPYVNNDPNLSQPDGIAFDASGTLYVASSVTNTVATFQATTGMAPGAFIKNYVAAGSGGLSTPRGVAFDPASGDLFVTGAHGVYRYQGPMGAMPGAPVGSGLYNATGINGGNGIVIDPTSGNLLVVSTNSGNVLKYGGTAGAGSYQGVFTGVFYGNDYLFVVSTGTDQVSQYGGTSGQTVPAGSYVSNFAAVFDPVGLAISPTNTNGDLYVAIGSAGGTQKGMVVEYYFPSQASSVPVYVGTVVDPETPAFTKDESVNAPQNITFDSTGDLYVVNAGDKDVLRFAPPAAAPAPQFPWAPLPAAGQTGAIYSNTGLVSPYGITLGGGFGGNKLYVTDDGYAPGEVLQFAAPSAIPGTGNEGTLLSPPGGFAAVFSPVSVAVDGSGHLYVANQAASPAGGMVEEFSSATGAYIKTFVAPSYITGGGLLLSPTDIALNPLTGDLFVSSKGTGSVLEYAAAGAPNNSIYVGDYTAGTAIVDPEGLAFDAAGRLYVADAGSNDVLEFTSSGSPGTQFVTPGQGGLSLPHGLAFDAAGDLYVASTGNNSVMRYTSTGANDPVAGKTGALFTGGAGVPFTDPISGKTQTDTNFGDVYVSWVTNDTFLLNGYHNPNNIRLVASDNGGATWSDPTFLNQGSDGGYVSNTGHDYSPNMIVSGLSNAVNSGGVLTAVWDNNPGNGGPDNIMLNTVATSDATVLAGAGGFVMNAPQPPKTPPNFIPTATFFPLTVTSGQFGLNFTTLSNLNVTLDVASAGEGINNLAILLVAPNGTTVTLMGNADDENGNPTGHGVTGNNIGQSTSLLFIGTTFDDGASNLITNVANPVGRYIPEEGVSVGTFGGGGARLSGFNGLTPAQLSGTWRLEFVNFNSSGTTSPPPFLRDWQLNFTSGLGIGKAVVAGTTNLHGNLYQAGTPGSTYTGSSTAANPIGVGPQPVVAEDETLGSFSPHQGAIYVAYVNHNLPNSTANPANNTDIALGISYDGGTTWNTSIVNNDDTSQDSTAVPTGPLFDPAIQVDQTTGTVAVTYFSARYDASQARVATVLQTSIDGGQSWSPESFLNQPNQVTDEATGNTVTVGPIPDNESSANPRQETLFGFGTRQSFIVSGGKVLAAWPSNLNGGLNSVNYPNNINLLNINVATAYITVGPRIVDGTSGVVSTSAGVNGGEEATFFDIKFDRPVLLSSINPGEITLQARDANGNMLTVQPVVTTIVPVGLPAISAGGVSEYTQFRVNFTPVTTPGTVSYSVGPNAGDPFAFQIHDLIRTFTSLGNVMDQSSSNAFDPVNPSDVFSEPASVLNVLTSGTASAATATTLTTQFVNWQFNQWAGDYVIITGGTGLGQVRKIFSNTGTIAFPTPPHATLVITTPWTTVPDSTSVFQIASTLNGGVPNHLGNYSSNSLPLIIPGPHVLSTNVGITVGTGSPGPQPFTNDNEILNSTGRYINFVFDRDMNPSTATQGVQSISVTNGGTGYTSAPTVTIAGGMGATANATILNGSIVSVSITNGGSGYATPPLVFFGGDNTSMATGIATIDANGHVTGVQITNPGSGYQSAPTVYFSGGATATATVSNGKVMSITVTNGGMFFTTPPAISFSGGGGTGATASAQLWPAPVLQIVGPAGRVDLPQTFSANNINQTVPKVAGQVLNSTINLPVDNNTFPIGNLSVTVNIQDAADADLTGYLIAPNGTKVRLFQNVAGQNFTNTVFNDSATTSINDPSAMPPFTGTFRPSDPLGLSQLFQGGINAVDLARDLLHSGWTLQLVDSNQADPNVAKLVSWSITATPVINVIPLSAGAALGSIRSFTVTFPQQQLSGTYTVQLASSIASFQTGIGGLGPNNVGPYQLDQNLNAGVYSLTNNFPTPDTLATTYASNLQTPATTPVSITPQTATSASQGMYNNVPVPDNDPNGGASLIQFPVDHGLFPISHLSVTVNITASSNADLTGYLISPDGVMVTLFSGLSGKNLTNTTFDDNGPQSITAGTAPYTATYQPVQALSKFNGADLAADSAHDQWQLLVVDSHTGGPVDTTTINSWSMTAEDNSFTSKIVVPDNYTIAAGTTVALDILDQHDPDLTAVLIPPAALLAAGVSPITLFSGVGATGTQQNFLGTIFNDGINPVTNKPFTNIANAGPPFQGTFSTQFGGTSTTGLNTLTGQPVNGVWTLKLINNTGSAAAATLKDWSITFNKAVSDSGMGEGVADQVASSFRIFTFNSTNPVASQTWTAVGPASLNNSNQSGRVTAIAVDPSDPSGNTVYAGGADGGVWKTTDFLTTAASGPTWIPLTDFGPTYAIDMGGLAVFPRNNDPKQSIIFAASGQGDASFNTGVGILRSEDGGQTWQLLDSTVNVDPAGTYLPLSSPLRDHAFVGTNSYKIIVDPKPGPDGNAIVYVVFAGGTNQGVWKSTDSGNTWGLANPNFNPSANPSPTNTVRIPNLAGQATDIAFSNASGTVNVISNPTGNLQIMFAALRGQGVFLSTDEGQSWKLMTGGIGNPLIQDGDVPGQVQPPVPVANGGTNPNAPMGRILLATPAFVPNYTPTDQFPYGVQNFVYEGWVYALVVAPDSSLSAIYMTKDFGQNWVNVPIPVLQTATAAVPTLDINQPNFNVLGNQGNYDVTLATNPLNPNIIYVGGQKNLDVGSQGFVRIDTTNIADAHAFYTDSLRDDGGQILVNAGSPVVVKRLISFPNVGNAPWVNPIMNLVNPGTVFFDSATYDVNKTQQFTNDGSGVTWSFMSTALDGSTDQHKLITMVDPLTGQARLIFGDDQGIFTGVDANGTFIDGVDTAAGRLGTSRNGFGTRNGNLQITELYQGAVQPSMAAAVSESLFYGGAQDNGNTSSGTFQSVIGQGKIGWGTGGGDASVAATDPGGSGSYYEYRWPCCGGGNTDFFEVDGSPRTNGLVLPASFTQDFPFVGVVTAFAVNPLQGNSLLGTGVNAGKAQLLLGSDAGRLFRTEDSGNNWFVIGDSSVLGGSNVNALAFGAPDSTITGSSLDSFIYAGMNSGALYVTTKGGGVGGGSNPWVQINTGALAGNSARIMAIVASPARGSHEAFVVTTNGVYFSQDTIGTFNPTTGARLTNPIPFVNITGNLFQLPQLNAFNDPTQPYTQLSPGALTSLAVDWRYVIPNNFAMPPANPTDPTQTHPMLYVAGTAGVFRSFDFGKTWSLFPSLDPTSASTGVIPITPGGDLPNVTVSNLSLSIGNVDPATGYPVQSPGDPNLLAATTFGRGTFAIRLAPAVFAQSLALDPNQPVFSLVPPIHGSDSGAAPNGSPSDKVTKVWNAVIDGYSEQSAFGNTVHITLVDETNPLNPVYIGGYDGAVIGGQLISGEPGGANLNDPTGTNAAYQTNATGQFAVPITVRMPDGVRTIGVVATDASGTQGNIALFTYTLITQKPPVPTGMSLDPNQPVVAPPGTSGSDSGVIGDNITNVTSPYFDVTGIENANTPGVPAPAAPFAVFLYRATSASGPWTLANAVTDPTLNPLTAFDTVVVQDPAKLTGSTAGTTYYYYATQQDVAGNVSDPPPAASIFSIIVKTSAQTPANLKLDPNKPTGGSDTGLSSTDSITDINTPFFNVSNIEPTARQVLLLRATSALGPYTIVNTESPVVFNGDGSVTIQDPSQPPPSDGTYFYEVEQVDVANNLSNPSTPLQVLIVTSTPTTPSIVLDPNSDSGVKLDKITNVTNPTFDVSGVTKTPPFPPDGPYQVILLRGTSASGPFSVIATGPGGTTGSATIQDPGAPIPMNPPVGGVSFWYEIEQEDVAGNISSPSTPLKITFKTTAQTATGVKLDPKNPSPGGSDTGTSATDSITNDTQPWINVSSIEASAQQIILLRAKGSPTNGFTQVKPPQTPVFNADGTVSIQDPGPVQPDDYYYYEVEQVDVAGNTSLASAPLQVLVVAAKPSTPSIVLDSASDSGVKGDNITNSTAPMFDVSGVMTTPPFPADGPYQVLLLRSTSLNGTYSVVKTVSGGASSITIQDDSGQLSGNPPDAGVTYYYKIEQEDVAGNFSVPSAALPITIKTMAQTPGMPALDPNHPKGGSDTGVSATDKVTNDAQPWVIVSGIEPNAQQVTLLRSTSAGGPFAPVKTLSSFTFNTDGSVSIQDPGPVPADGTYYYEVQQLDVAGNTSLASSPLQVLIVTTKPSTPSVSLDPTTDTGPSNSDGITKVTSPQFVVNGLSTTPPFPADGPYTVTLLRSTSASGPFTSVPFTTVSGAGTSSIVVRDNGPVTPDGDYYYEVEQEDVAGNLSPATTPVHVLIVTSKPSTPSIKLDPAPTNDTGVLGDNITSNTAPIFDANNVMITPPFPADGPYLVNLLRSTSPNGPFTVVNTVSGGTGGSTTIQDNSGQLSGNVAGISYYYELTTEDVAGNLSDPTGALKITIKTQAQTPNTPVLDSATDSGTKGDNVTSVTNPSFDVAGIELTATDALLLRKLHGSNNPFVQVGSMSPVVFNNGVVTITDTAGVTTDGQYDYYVQYHDVAGNLSSPSPVLTITIDTTLPSGTKPGAPVLAAQSDSGISNSDGITNHDGTAGTVANPKSLIFTVNVGPSQTDTWVYLYDVAGGGRKLLAGPVQAVNGVATLTVAGNTPLQDGTHQFIATEAANGNAGTQQYGDSPNTPVTIITSTTFDGYSTQSPFYNNSDQPLPGSFVAMFSHPLANITPDVGNGTGFNASNAYSFMLIPSGPDDAASFASGGPAWSGPSGIDMGDLPLHSTLVYHVNGSTPLASSQITLTPTVPMGTDLYLLSVGGLNDLAGNPVTFSGGSGPYFSFDYRPTPFNLTPPTITSVTANHGASTIFPLSTQGGQVFIQQPDTIAVHFSKPMDFYQVASKITLHALPQPGVERVVNSVVTYSPSTQTAYITPTEKLSTGVQYILSVDGTLTDDQGFPNPGVPLGAPKSFAFYVTTNAAGPGVAPLKVTATSPLDGNLVQQQFGYVSTTFTQPISFQSLQRYSAMLIPNPAGPNSLTPVNAKLAFNPNTNQLIIVPTDTLGNALDVLALGNIYSALSNGQPNLTNPLLNNPRSGLPAPAGINGNAPYYATWQLQVSGAAAHVATRQSTSAMITVSAPADPTQTAGAVVTASAATTTTAPAAPIATPTDHVSGNRVAQAVAIPKKGHVRLTMHNSARDRGDVLSTALIALERDRVRPGRWV